MPYRNRSNRLRPINTLKHTVDSQQVIPAGTEVLIDLINAVDAAQSTTANACDIGSHVRSIFLNVQVLNSVDPTGLVPNVYMYIFGNPGNNIASAQFPPVNDVGTSDSRKMIFHQEMAMMSDANDSIPIQLFKGVLKIPRKFSRLGVSDKIVLKVGTPAGGAEVTACVQCIYKEIR